TPSRNESTIIRYATLCRSDGIRTGAGVLSVATVAGLAVFTLVAPLQPGWARKAGTPLKLLGVHTAAAATRATSAKGPLDRARREIGSTRLNSSHLVISYAV